MDNIQQIIHCLDPQEQKEFSYFIQRLKNRNDRKDLRLFQFLKKDMAWKAKDLIQRIPTKNANAYHTIRKRLFGHLSAFIILKSHDKKENNTSGINACYNLSIYLFDQELFDLGWKYLLQAQELAKEQQHFTWLHAIHLLQIEMAHLQQKYSLDEIIQTYHENRRLLQIDEKFVVIQSLIRQDLLDFKKSGQEFEFDTIIKRAMQTSDIQKTVENAPRLFFRLVQIIRSGIIARKEFNSFEPFLVNHYHRLFATLPNNNPYKTKMLYLMAHTFYRNKKFNASLDAIDEMQNSLDEGSKSQRRLFQGRLWQLKSANLMFLGKLNEGITHLQSLLNSTLRMSVQLKANTIVNLGIYHFLEGEFKTSLSLLNELEHSDKWYQKHMGIEWVFKKNMMEVILYYDLDHIGLCESRIRSIERTYQHLKGNPIYNRAFVFLSLIKSFILNVEHEDLSNKIETSFDWLPKEEEDLQAISFYSWLKSKIQKKSFYDTLLEIVQA